MRPSLCVVPTPACMPVCPQGFGTVRFESEEDASRAIERFDGFEIDGRQVQVKLDMYG